MESYLMMMYVTLEQETALKNFFTDQGWAFCKPDLSVTTDKLGPAIGPENTSNVTGKRKAQGVPKTAPKVKLAKVSGGTPTLKSILSTGNSENVSEGSNKNSGKGRSETTSPDTEQFNIPAIVHFENEDEEQTNVMIKIENINYNIEHIGEEYTKGSQTECVEEVSDDTITDDSMEDTDGETEEDEVDHIKQKTRRKSRNKNKGQAKGLKAKVCRLQYDRGNLPHAIEATQRGMSVYRAARQFKVPESTLRDRTRGNVGVDVKIGFTHLLDHCEEQHLVNHISHMADIGYGYTKTDIQYIGRDFALSLGKTVKSQKALSDNWFYDFLGRWPNLKRVTPQKLSPESAKSASKEHLDAYFRELGTILSTNSLHEHPDRIYYIDATSISTEQSLTQSVTSLSTTDMTIIACGNAIGNYVPPYYVFPGKHWDSDLVKRGLPGSDGEMTETGAANSCVLTNYFTKHLVKYIPLSENEIGPKTLILYNGHKLHIGLTLTEWAKLRNVVLFVQPPLSNHLMHTLDVCVIEQFKTMFNHQCQVFKKQNPRTSLTRYKVAELTASPYTEAMRAENVIPAFSKAGVYPFGKQVLNSSRVVPAGSYDSDS